MHYGSPRMTKVILHPLIIHATGPIPGISIPGRRGDVASARGISIHGRVARPIGTWLADTTGDLAIAGEPGLTAESPLLGVFAALPLPRRIETRLGSGGRRTATRDRRVAVAGCARPSLTRTAGGAVRTTSGAVVCGAPCSAAATAISDTASTAGGIANGVPILVA